MCNSGDKHCSCSDCKVVEEFKELTEKYILNLEKGIKLRNEYIEVLEKQVKDINDIKDINYPF